MGRRRERAGGSKGAAADPSAGNPLNGDDPWAPSTEHSQDSVDDFYEGLSNSRRRQILYLVKATTGETVTVSELATLIAAWEHDTDPEEVRYDDRKSVQTTIYQHHAPKLDEAGLVEYDERANELSLAIDPDSLLFPDLPDEYPADDGSTDGRPSRRLTLVGAVLATVAVVVGTQTTATWPLVALPAAAAGALLAVAHR